MYERTNGQMCEIIKTESLKKVMHMSIREKMLKIRPRSICENSLEEMSYRWENIKRKLKRP